MQKFPKLSPTQLAQLDDTVTSLIVDPWLGFTTHKMFPSEDLRKTRKDATNRNLKLREILAECVVQDTPDGNLEVAFGNLFLQSSFFGAEKKGMGFFPDGILAPGNEMELLKEYAFVYLRALSETSGFKFVECNRYTRDDFKGVKIVATKFWGKGEEIKDLKGFSAELSEEEEKYMIRPGVNDFSIMYSCRNKRPQLWLGPASYVNHDCEPNCEFKSTGKTAAIRVIKDIEEGDELLCMYGRHYFGIENEYCECKTCESQGKGAFSDRIPPRSSTPSPKTEKYALRLTPNRKLKRLQLSEECSPEKEKRQKISNFKEANVTVESILSRPAVVRLKRLKIVRIFTGKIASI